MTRVPYIPTLAAFAAVVFAGNTGRACDPPQIGDKKPAFFCPVAGLPETKACGCVGGYCSLRPTKDLTALHKGATLQFCCARCVKMFKDDAAKFAVAANHQLVATNQAKQVKCPLTGEKVDASVILEVAAINVAFASEECKKKIADAKPAERANLVFGEQAFARGFVVTIAKRP